MHTVAIDVNFPTDFLVLSITAAEHLKKGGRGNVLYLLAKALGTKRPDGTDTLLPIKRLPMGMIEHCANFFNATSVTQVHNYKLILSQSFHSVALD